MQPTTETLRHAIQAMHLHLHPGATMSEAQSLTATADREILEALEADLERQVVALGESRRVA